MGMTRRRSRTRHSHRLARRLRDTFLFGAVLMAIALTVTENGAAAPEPAAAPSAGLSRGEAARSGGGGAKWISVGTTVHPASAGATLHDHVTRVRDGDTIVVGLIPIRIANLDCSEKGTRAGDAATRRAKELVVSGPMTCRLEGRRSYDREVGLCALPDGRDFGQVLIAEGFCGRWRG